MARSSVYLETSVLSYLASRPSRDVIVLAQQQLTIDWWQHQRKNYDIFVSAIVVTEALRGDANAALRRAKLLDGIAILEVDEPVIQLARQLNEKGAIPANASQDALHIAVAAVCSVTYLLTWNYKHIANATMRSQIGRVCEDAGYVPPIICTPVELGDHDVG